MTFKNARIPIPTTPVFGKYPRVRRIFPQMITLALLEIDIWKMSWEGAKATKGPNRRGTVYVPSSTLLLQCTWVHVAAR